MATAEATRPEIQQTAQSDDLLARAERLQREGRFAEAEALCHERLAAGPDAPAAHMLGMLAHRQGRLQEAIGHVQSALNLAPRNALYRANLGEMLRIAGRPKEAAEELERAVEMDPGLAIAHTNLGVARYDLKDFDASIRAHRNAIASRPDFAEAHSNLGNALYALKRFDEAIAAYRRAIELRPNFADAWANLGTTLHHAGSFEHAAFALRRAIALAPGHANARSGLGILLLMRGDFAEGWDEYEWRLRSTEQKGPEFPLQPWQGDSLAGKHIYVQAEQGLGDTIQFVRFIPMIANRAAKVTLRVQQPLVTLVQESLPGIPILGARGPTPEHDCDVALLSLTRLLRTRTETIPAAVPYLFAPADTASRWQDRLGPKPDLKVGLVWAGNPQHANDFRRSLDVALLAPLLAVSGTTFFSLQVGPRSRDMTILKAFEGSIEDLSPDLEDFADTAAAIAALDLVITVDTSIAHLAGAVGKPVWVLLPWVTDWRWGRDRQDCVWYPTMRLFRQRRGQDFAEVIAWARGELAAVAAGNRIPLTPFKGIGERRAADAAAIITIESARATRQPASDQQAVVARPTFGRTARRRPQVASDGRGRAAASASPPKPGSAEAIHASALAAHQSGRSADAIKIIQRAIELDPSVALYHRNLGEMCRIAGRIDEAVAAGRRSVELDPKEADAHNNLGIALFDQGNFEEALVHLDQAIAKRDDFAQAHSNRGNTLQRLQRFAEAEQAYRRALELEPNFPDAWNNLGTCFREQKRLDEAENAYRKSLQLRPNSSETLDNLALAIKDREHLEEAAQLFRQALRLDPQNAKIHIHYAAVLFDMERVDEAAAATERAFALTPNSHEVINMMGRVAFKSGQLQSAVDYYRRAIALKPDLAEAYNNMGNALKELGKIDESTDAYLKAIQLEPQRTSIYFNFADSHKFTPDDPHLTAMKALSAKTDLSNTERIEIDFALGKAYADIRDFERSFTHLKDGNAAKRATISYDEASSIGLIDRIERVFTPELIAAKSGSGDSSTAPIFVIGMPRSGTTLIEQIIASHPMVYAAGELRTFNEVVLTVRGADNNVIPYPEFVPALTSAAVTEIGARYLAAVRKLLPEDAQARPHITDKMPSNYLFAGLIHLALPNAKIIHSNRDPIDTCVSCYSKLFASQQNHTYDLGEIGRYHKRYQGLMDHWRRVLPSGRMLEVVYEDVVANVEQEARRILDYCGLPWDDRCLDFHKTDRVVRTASATQVRQGIYNSSVGRWRVYEKDLGSLLQALAR